MFFKQIISLTLFDCSSKLAAGVLGGLDKIFIKPGSKVLYLGAGMFIVSCTCLGY